MDNDSTVPVTLDIIFTRHSLPPCLLFF